VTDRAIRKRALRLLEAGMPIAEIAKKLGKSRQSIHTWVREERAREEEARRAPGAKRAAKAPAAAAAPAASSPDGTDAWARMASAAEEAIRFALDIMRDKRSAPQTRLSAAVAILDRAGYTPRGAEQRAKAKAAADAEAAAKGRERADLSALTDEEQAELDRILRKARGAATIQ
jgi:hypothetical protein